MVPKVIEVAATLEEYYASDKLAFMSAFPASRDLLGCRAQSAEMGYWSLIAAGQPQVWTGPEVSTLRTREEN